MIARFASALIVCIVGSHAMRAQSTAILLTPDKPLTVQLSVGTGLTGPTRTADASVRWHFGAGALALSAVLAHESVQQPDPYMPPGTMATLTHTYGIILAGMDFATPLSTFGAALEPGLGVGVAPLARSRYQHTCSTGSGGSAPCAQSESASPLVIAGGFAVRWRHVVVGPRVLYVGGIGERGDQYYSPFSVGWRF